MMSIWKGNKLITSANFKNLTGVSMISVTHTYMILIQCPHDFLSLLNLSNFSTTTNFSKVYYINVLLACVFNLDSSVRGYACY